MPDFASLSGIRVFEGSISIPLYGLWSGDVTVSSEEGVPDTGTLSIGNLSLACAIYRQLDFTGLRRCRLVGGFGGWRKEVSPRQYVLDSGLNLSLVLGDAANEVGEKVNVPTDRVIGPGYVREKGPASRCLRQLAGANWYIDPAGVTQIAAWPTTKIGSQFDVIEYHGDRGEAEIATEDFSSWLPGRTFTSATLGVTLSNGGVTYTFKDDGQLRLSVLTVPT